ncbi:MAG: hypothetical protein EPN22_12990 [Nitrospirae bacterium]|nr:MAG: hypothetical protein EPN22_12990 [Nitrospirota bacterium]
MYLAYNIIEFGRRRAKIMKVGAKRRVLVVGLMILSMLGMAVVAQGTILNSKHDLSKSGGAIGVCAFCHTPHFASSVTDVKPLWNRALQSFSTYSMYDSPTFTHQNATPSTASLMCLGCHDGINSAAPTESKHVLLNVGGSKYTFSTNFADANVNCNSCHVGGTSSLKQNLQMGWWYNPDLSGGAAAPLTIPGYEKNVINGINLTDDHPISMVYPSNSQFVAAVSGKVDTLPLYGASKNMVECPSCHDPHNTTNGLFLRKSNAGSALCLTCHIK